MKKLRMVLALALAASLGIAAASCTSFQISGIEVAQQTSSGDVLGTFDIKVSTLKFLGFAGGTNLFNVTSGATDPKIVDAVKAEVAKLGGSRAINVKIEYQASFIHLLLNGITGTIVAPATARVTGTVIR